MSKTPVPRPTYDELKKLGCMVQSHAYALAHGRKRPSLKLATKIEAKTGYPAGAWYARD